MHHASRGVLATRTSPAAIRITALAIPAAPHRPIGRPRIPDRRKNVRQRIKNILVKPRTRIRTERRPNHLHQALRRRATLRVTVPVVDRARIEARLLIHATHQRIKIRLGKLALHVQSPARDRKPASRLHSPRRTINLLHAPVAELRNLLRSPTDRATDQLLRHLEQHVAQRRVANTLAHLGLQRVPQALKRVQHPPAAATLARRSAATQIGGRIDVLTIPLQREVKVRTRRAARATDPRNIRATTNRRARLRDVGRQVVVARDETVPEHQLKLVARRSVPGMPHMTGTHSLKDRTGRHRPVNTLVPTATSAEPVTTRIRARERLTQLDQAALRVPEST